MFLQELSKDLKVSPNFGGARRIKIKDHPIHRNLNMIAAPSTAETNLSWNQELKSRRRDTFQSMTLWNHQLAGDRGLSA